MISARSSGFRLAIAAIACGMLNATISWLESTTQAEDSSSPMTATPAADGPASASEHAPRSVAEARARARILHETLHGTLQVMHRDFFREDDGTRIPSRSLADVFSELEKSYEIKLHWLAVDTKAMHIDHEPQTDFEKAAVAAFKADESEYEQVDGDAYRYAGRIRLSAVCLTCHLSRRSNNNDRSAALTITMPWAKHGAGE
jgi:hypothetical protein